MQTLSKEVLQEAIELAGSAEILPAGTALAQNWRKPEQKGARCGSNLESIRLRPTCTSGTPSVCVRSGASRTADTLLSW